MTRETRPRNLRLKGSIVCDGMLRLYRLAREYFDGDLETFVIYLAVVSANVSRFQRAPDRLRYAEDTPPPEDERTPISRRAIALSVNLPRETVRRKVVELMRKGHVYEVSGGLRAVWPVLEHNRNLDLALGLISTFQRTAEELRLSDDR